MTPEFQFAGQLQKLASLWRAMPPLLLMVHAFYTGRVTSNLRLANSELVGFFLGGLGQQDALAVVLTELIVASDCQQNLP